MILQQPALGRRLVAETVGTGILAMVVIGSGIQAAALTQDGAVRFLANVLASVCALGVLIALLGPVSGAHLNPLLSAGVWWTGRGRPGALTGRELAGYVLAQVAGAVGGAVLANAMFGRPAVDLSHHVRSGGAVWTGEVVATGVLLLLVFGLTRGGRDRYAPVAVAGWISAACWGTASGSFANPALTLGRAFSDSYAGIAPGSVPAFVLAQLVGAVAGLTLVSVLFGGARRPTEENVPVEAAAAQAAGPVREPVAELIRTPRLSRA
ncbi:aquaporin [Kitasatospora mediocidica]|uniref:aquaporin n=1 Tax=Kitasatospora mediocidica TaxID=58352 RepID=UPI0006921115|nr:aquaporin [Kitasatospora mediocidica]